MTTFYVLKSQLLLKFKNAIQKNSFPEFYKDAKVILSKTTDVKKIVESTIQEVLLNLIKQDADSILLERVLQFSIDAALNGIAPANLPVLVLGHIFESSTIDKCEKYFSFVESRVDTFKKDFFFQACKINLLKSCNDLLKRLSRCQNTVFCGRILMFLAQIFPFSERSGLNIISEFNLENTTTFSTADEDFSDLTLEKEDVTEECEISLTSQSPMVVDKNLYKKFWSLQDYFRNPNTCYQAEQWKDFITSTSDVLTVFGSFKSDDANNSKFKQVKIPSPSGACAYFAKYLTSPKLLELELSDSHFQRYFLVQVLILFQYLSSPVKFKLQNFVMSEEQQKWIKDTVKRVYQLLEETPPNGETFARDVEKILKREEYWNVWKNEGCPALKTLTLTDKADLEKRLNKHSDDDLRQYPNEKAKSEFREFPKTLNLMTNNWEACRSAKRKFVPPVESFFGITGDKNDKGQPVIIKKETSDPNYSWRALRLLTMQTPHMFTANNAPAKSVPEYLDSVIHKIAKEKPQSNQEVVETTVTEDLEDGKEDIDPDSEGDSKEEDPAAKELLYYKRCR